MSKLIISIGIPGSGKTTFLKKFATDNNAVYICPDDIRLEVTGDESNQEKNPEVWDIARNRLHELLMMRKDVVFDATFANHFYRESFISEARNVGELHVTGIYFDIPLQIAEYRNKNRKRIVPFEVLKKMHISINNHPPKTEEGFDRLTIVNEHGKSEEISK